uniref:Uncharacterized protein n=1 Tax=Parascaris equorum TaxID=6256 RepID=A0A914S847_PAREQ
MSSSNRLYERNLQRRIIIRVKVRVAQRVKTPPESEASNGAFNETLPEAEDYLIDDLLNITRKPQLRHYRTIKKENILTKWVLADSFVLMIVAESLNGSKEVGNTNGPNLRTISPDDLEISEQM